jgi:hypothetical protein
MNTTHVKTGLKWVGLYLLANLIGASSLRSRGQGVNSPLVAAIIFACISCRG